MTVKIYFKTAVFCLCILLSACGTRKRIQEPEKQPLVEHPRVKIGILQDVNDIQFTPLKDADVRNGDTKLTLKKNEKYTVRFKTGTPALLKYYLVLQSLLPTDNNELALDSVKANFPEAELLTLGRSDYGNNERSLIVLPSTNNRHNLEKKMIELQKQNILTWILPMSVNPGEVTFSLTRGKSILLDSIHKLDIDVISDGVIIHKVEYGKGYPWHGFEDRKYRGKIIFTASRSGGLACVLRTMLDIYVLGVLPYELPQTAPIEALKAQAIAARTEILSKMDHRHLDEPYDLCSEQHCQVFGGENRTSDTLVRVIKETSGMIMVTDQKTLRLQDTRYSSNCGGFTENNENAWNLPPDPHLRGKSDAIADVKIDLSEETGLRKWLSMNTFDFYCGDTLFTKPEKFRWSVKLIGKELTTTVNKHFRVGKIKSIKLLERGVSGRLKHIRVIGADNSVDVYGELNIRRTLGNLKSSAFVIDAKNNKEGIITEIALDGAGWGHGVGMCQIGAISRANHGQDFLTILKHYYDDVQITSF